MPWDNIEFTKLCNSKGLPESKIYQNTLAWKFACASYHNKRGEKVWDDLYQESKKTGISINWSSREWGEAMLKSEAEAVACAHVVNTMVDVFLQIINSSLLQNRFPESKVKISKIKKELEKHKGMSEILSKLKSLENSDEFKYIRAFDNTLKHRRLIDLGYTVHINTEEARKGIKFRDFEYNGNVYSTTWAQDITEKYRKTIIDYIWEIGNAMNEYLKN